MARSNVWSLPVLVVVPVLLTACGTVSAASKTQPRTAIPLAAAHLSPYAATYKVSGPATGTTAVQVIQSTSGTIHVTQSQSIGKATVHGVFTLADKGLTVRQATKQIEAPGEKVTITAQLHGQEMKEIATVNGRVESPTIALRSPWLVNGVLLTALSGVQLRPGETGAVEDVILQHATGVPMALSVGKETSISTPIGNLRCYAVTLSAGGKVQTAWYEAAKPHVMLQYVNGQETFMIATLNK